MVQVIDWNNMSVVEKNDLLDQYFNILKEKMIKAKSITISSKPEWHTLVHKKTITSEDITFEIGYY
ncbi:hypothetical protein AB0Y20_00985 [Heyndrickxia oleronia]|uniref:hypothetical protein n=1 Tax=Heyndrickxia oleronia TaxID=38875 RepID=UPI003F20494F